MLKKGEQIVKHTKEQKIWAAVRCILQGGACYQSVANAIGMRDASKIKLG